MSKTTNTKTTANEIAKAMQTVKNGIERTADGKMTLTTNGIKTTIDSATGAGIVPTIEGSYKLRDDLKNKPIGKHIANINKYVNNIKIAVISIGKELSEINNDKSYTDLGYKSFTDFYTNYLGMKKATVYQNINAYLMCCDIFGNIKIDFEKAGDVNANKALRIGMTPDDFQKTIEQADKEGLKLTAENMTEVADRAGANYDKEKAIADTPKKSKKTVVILPDKKDGYARFISSDKKYIDIPTKIVTDFENDATADKTIRDTINDGIDEKTTPNLVYDFRRLHIAGQYLIVTTNNKGMTRTYTMIKDKTDSKKK